MSSDSPSAWGAPSPSGTSPSHAARPQLSSPSAAAGGGGGASSAAAAAAASPFLSAFRGLDLHGKVASEYVVRTKQGALVSLGALALAVALFIAELRFFLQTEVEETLEVDAARGQRMRITFDVTFPSLPCAAVSVDSQDASGTANLEVLHNVFKRRLTPSGSPVGDAEHTGDGTPGKPVGGTLKSPADLLREREKAAAAGRPVGPTAAAATPDDASGDAAREGDAERARAAAAPGTPTCGTCYGAGAEGECCDTCESVREVYRRRGWQFNMRGVAQCEKEGFYGDVSAQMAAGEGCNLYGFLEVPLVPGNFHFAPGHAMQHAYNHVHDLVQFAHEAFNASHTVNSVAFTAAGEAAAGAGAAGGGSVLDGRSLILTEGTGMHQYFCKLVPTVFVPLGAAEPAPGAVASAASAAAAAAAAGGRRARYAFDFSVTEHLRHLDARSNTQQAQLEAATGLLPGLFFNYETSPIRVRRVEKRRSLVHFCTEVAAIVGGAMTIGSFVDALVSLVAEQLGREGRRKAAAGGGLVA